MRAAAGIAAAGVAVFVVCSLLAHGGPLASGSFGDVYEYHLYEQHMTAGQWPYRDFFVDQFSQRGQRLPAFPSLGAGGRLCGKTQRFQQRTDDVGQVPVAAPLRGSLQRHQRLTDLLA